MLKIAEKFKSLDKMPQMNSAGSSIFGASNLSQNLSQKQSINLSMYPIIDTQNPDIAMGIASCLCYLIEQNEPLKVYRVFAKFDDDETSNDEITSNDYQFRADDWEFEGLDDNLVVQGSIKHIDGLLELTLVVDTGLLLHDIPNKTLKYELENYSQLVSQLPMIANDILKDIITNQSPELIITYAKLNIPEGVLRDILSNVFYWNLDLYLYFWEIEWDEDNIISQFNEMIDISTTSQNEFAMWCTAMLAKQVMTVSLATIGEVIIPTLDRSLPNLNSSTISVVISQGLVKLGYLSQAIDILEQLVKIDKSDSKVWVTLIEIYIKANSFSSALDYSQQALENITDDIQLYWYYIQLLITAETQDLSIESVLFINPDEIPEVDHLKHEIVQSLLRILEIKEDTYFAIKLLLEYLIHLQDEETLHYLKLFINHVLSTPDEIRMIIDKLYDYKNLSDVLFIFEEYKDNHSYDSWAYIYLAHISLISHELDTVPSYLESATKQNSSDNPDITLEIQRLHLDTELDDFAQEYSDIIIMLDANRAIGDDAVDLLESAIELAPLLADIHVTLARCYLSWKDNESALEVLAEATTILGTHPRIEQIQAQIFWGTGQKTEALDKLNKILKMYPNDIETLTQLAQFLIENNQLEDSKVFIERVETLAPSHPKVWQLRKLIANKINQ